MGEGSPNDRADVQENWLSEPMAVPSSSVHRMLDWVLNLSALPVRVNGQRDAVTLDGFNIDCIAAKSQPMAGNSCAYAGAGDVPLRGQPHGAGVAAAVCAARAARLALLVHLLR